MVGFGSEFLPNNASPFNLYEPTRLDGKDGLFSGQDGDAPAFTRRDAITDEGLARFVAAYPGETITKGDVFHYVYGLLHSEDYRERYADNLTKQLPRIPLTDRAKTRCEAPYGRAENRFSRFFLLCAVTGREIWAPRNVSRSFRTVC